MTTGGTAPGEGRAPDDGRAPGQDAAADGSPPTGEPLRAWADRTSCVQGGDLAFHLTGAAGAAVRVTVTEVIGEQVRLTAAVHAPDWTLTVPEEWPSSLYRATFDVPLENRPTTCEAEHEVWFAVRAARPGTASRILVPIPFATWRAYTHAGQPHRGLYYAEQPYRAARVSFASPGGGPPPERWEEGLLRWLPGAGYQVDFCSGLDLHNGDELLSHYRLLVVNGHDEYWSMEMRDSVEAFARRGGNVAFFAANTAWWQMRLEDDGRTMVCHRDAVTDPMTAVDPRRTTVEWSSAPVDRPENTMTGLSFRRGAGAWGEGMAVMGKEAYTARFADHWVFEGTGLTDGEPFARGALGYETDACALEWTDGVPRATGVDGTPGSFVVLATADLRHWREYGQGGAATMGVFRLGAGTVFNAGTINWGSVLADDPVTDRITRNVLDRLSGAAPGDGWDAVGGPDEVRALAVCESVLFGADTRGRLLCREVSGQNLPWRPVGTAPRVRALAAGREAAGGLPLELYAATEDGRLLRRAPVAGPCGEGEWAEAGEVPRGTTGLALCDAGLFAVTPHDDTLHHLSALDPAGPWRVLGDAGGAIALAAMNCRLWAVTADGRLRTRLPAGPSDEPVPFADAGPPGPPADPRTTLAAHAGVLFATAPGGPPLMCARPALPPR
ncbi:N,N-dimethylformamidase beta subunit family domain-containing protein [Streptomyces sp. NPDC101178]|uniref:N,N-dimethylformamidase beta subunit family domain-containing protein n=1 Tax=Streptomyces sp. NPDC101178 TaxID=3366124 RepID=UPI00380B1324